MLIIPAIDLLDGKVVRLHKGMKNTATVYSDNALDIALKWKKAGAELIHVIDLDAAFSQGDNLEIIKKIIDNGFRIQVGGGIRTIEKAQQLIDAGVERIIIGTKATDDVFLTQLLEKFGSKVAVGVDVLKGTFMQSGWEDKSGYEFMDFVNYLVAKGVKCIIYTDISRDGTLEGLNCEEPMRLKNLKDVEIILSGGASSLDEFKKIKENLSFVYGIISGKALYENRIDLKEAVQLLK